METIKDIFERTISQVIRLKLGLDIYEYVIDEKISGFRNFEAELDLDYPIKGTEVKFSEDAFSKWSSIYDNHKIVNEEKDMASMDITDELASEPFRYKEMTFVYLFTLLEDFGNSLVEKINNPFYVGEIQSGKSWHSQVNRLAKNKGKDLVLGFATPFNLDRTEVSEKFVDLFYSLKQTRNSIAHELHYPEIREFKKDVQSLILLICYLYHINDTDKLPMKLYPWHDYNADDITLDED